MGRSRYIESHIRFNLTRMSAKGITITLLYLTRALVHCAYNNTESSEDKSAAQKCCLRNISATDDRRCSFEDLNGTLPVISYHTLGNVSTISCCTTCSQKTFGTEVGPDETETEQKYVNIEATVDVERSCFETCFANGQIIRVWKERSNNGSAGINDTSAKVDESRRNESVSWHCNSVFTSLNFWGANIVIFANAIYIVPYVVVVFVCFAVPGLSTRAYNKAVICYNASQLVLNGILIGIGASVLCHVSIYSYVYIFLGLTIMFLTISSTCWLFVICIDMTLVITRFRWASKSDSSQQKENKKFLTYAIWSWGGSLLPTALACIAELSSLLPKSSPIKPNFEKFNDGANLAVIVYVATVPALICLANTVLFCYTSYKMILIQKSTMLATESSTLKMNTARKRYFLFLKLYLLMDTPWITSALAAAFTDLWLLKFLRMIQPMIMLLAILPPRTIRHVFACGCLRQKSIRTSKCGSKPLKRSEPFVIVSPLTDR